MFSTGLQWTDTQHHNIYPSCFSKTHKTSVSWVLTGVPVALNVSEGKYLHSLFGYVNIWTYAEENLRIYGVWGMGLFEMVCSEELQPFCSSLKPSSPLSSLDTSAFPVNGHWSFCQCCIINMFWTQNQTLSRMFTLRFFYITVRERWALPPKTAKASCFWVWNIILPVIGHCTTVTLFWSRLLKQMKCCSAECEGINTEITRTQHH